jgi:hypothetical protein
MMSRRTDPHAEHEVNTAATQPVDYQHGWTARTTDPTPATVSRQRARPLTPNVGATRKRAPSRERISTSIPSALSTPLGGADVAHPGTAMPAAKPRPGRNARRPRNGRLRSRPRSVPLLAISETRGMVDAPDVETVRPKDLLSFGGVYADHPRPERYPAPLSCAERSLSSNRASPACRQSRDARRRRVPSRMSTSSELRFAMSSGATPAPTPRSRRCLRIA